MCGVLGSGNECSEHIATRDKYAHTGARHTRTKIGEFDFASMIDQNVAWLDVAVDGVMLMHVLQALECAENNMLEQALGLQPTSVNNILNRSTCTTKSYHRKKSKIVSTLGTVGKVVILIKQHT